MTAPAAQDLRWWEIPTLVDLERRLFPGDSPWDAEMFFAELATGNRYRVVRDADGAVIGYAGLALHGEDTADGEAEVQTIGIHPDRQGQGLGRLLLADLLAAAGRRQVLLEVRVDNTPAITLYESTGFHRIGKRRHYYQPSGADAFVMRRPGIAGPHQEAPR